MSKKLKPCPFCGGEDIRYEEDDLIVIYCYECDCQARKCETLEEAIEAWNRREPMDNIVKQLEELEERANIGKCADNEPNCPANNCEGHFVRSAIKIVKVGGAKWVD